MQILYFLYFIRLSLIAMSALLNKKSKLKIAHPFWLPASELIWSTPVKYACCEVELSDENIEKQK